MPQSLITLRWWARVYGWVPEQVAELDLETYHWFPAIEEADSEAQRLKQHAESPPEQRKGPQWRA